MYDTDSVSESDLVSVSALTPRQPTGSKRRAPASDPSASGPRKRAPYASRACDACRRRKGRCSGSQPCVYCEAKSLPCITTDYGFEQLPDAGHAAPAAAPLMPSQSTLSHLPDAVLTSQLEPGSSTPPPGPSTPPPGSGRRRARPRSRHQRSGGSLRDLVSRLENRVQHLSSQIRVRNAAPPPSEPWLAPNGTGRAHDNGSQPGEGPSEQQRPSPVQAGCFARDPKTHWYGPTSPDYSLHVAQVRVRFIDSEGSGQRYQCSPQSLMEEGKGATSDETSDDDARRGPNIQGSSTVRNSEPLRRCLQLMTEHEALRLLHTYQRIFGDLHPLLDMSRLVRLVQSMYDQPVTARIRNSNHTVPVEETDLMMINLVLSIALSAGASPSARLGKQIYSACQAAIIGRVLTSAPSLTNVVLALCVVSTCAQLTWICQLSSLIGHISLLPRRTAAGLEDVWIGRQCVARTWSSPS